MPADDTASLRQPRLPTLTGMRFLAAFLVFVTHVCASGIFSDQELSGFLADNVSQAGYVGVSFFFILSGFILTWTARSKDAVGRFWRRRAAKVLPNYVVTWVVATVLTVVAGTATVASTMPSLFVLQAWYPAEEVVFLPNGPAWSLCAEVVFYLAFPWLLPLVRRIREERLWLWIGLLWGACWAIPFLAQVLPEQPSISYDAGVSWYQYWFVYLLPVARVPEFVLGMVMARVVMSGRWIRIGLLPAMLAVVPGYALIITLPDVYGLVAPTVLPLALVVAAGATADTGGRGSPFRGRAMVFLGEISYAFFLVHNLVLLEGVSAITSGETWSVPAGLGLTAFSLAMSVACATALYRLVEAPFMRRWSRPRSMTGNSVQVSGSYPGSM